MSTITCSIMSVYYISKSTQRIERYIWIYKQDVLMWIIFSMICGLFLMGIVLTVFYVMCRSEAYV